MQSHSVLWQEKYRTVIYLNIISLRENNVLHIIVTYINKFWFHIKRVHYEHGKFHFDHSSFNFTQFHLVNSNSTKIYQCQFHFQLKQLKLNLNWLRTIFVRCSVTEFLNNLVLEILHFKDWIRHNIKKYVTASNNMSKARHDVKSMQWRQQLSHDDKKYIITSKLHYDVFVCEFG